MNWLGPRITQSVRSLGGGFALAVMLPLLAVAPALAAPSINIDGTLTDLEAAIAANLGPAKGGNICTDVTGEIGSIQCAYYVNGYDMERFLVLVDPLVNPDGTFTGDVDVYAGWDQVGKIGDVDGNGNPDTFTPLTSCASSDQPGVGAFESYVVDFDFNCDGVVDARFGVKGNKVINFFTLAEVPGGLFAFNNSTLEVKIPSLKVNAAAAFDICDMRIAGGSNAEFDQLAEDDCQPAFVVAFDPVVSVSKTPDTQSACPGSQVSWTITVKNTGPCNLDEVNVEDVLDVGMSYVSDDQGSTGDVQTRNWQFANLPAGGTIIIHVTAQLAPECAAASMNNVVRVEGTHLSACRPEPVSSLDDDTAVVNCTKPECAITGPDAICLGGSAEFCGPDVAGLTYKWSTGATTRCVTVSAAGTYTLEVTDVNGCKSSCEKVLIVNPLPECVIAGPAEICQGASAEFCGPDVAGYTYKWSTGATTRCITVNAAGTYTLEITDAKGCKSTCEKALVVNPLPECVIGGPDAICTGGSAEFCGPDVAGYTYKWSTGATARCITVNAAGTYTLEITDPKGCKSTCEKVLAVNDNPTCEISGPGAICQGGSAEFCGPDGAGLVYKWSTGATTRCITVNAAGTYSLEVTDANGCKSTCEKTLVVNPLPECVITGPAEICQGASAEFCGPDVAGYAYKWSTGATTRCITVNVAGTYTLEITDAKGCKSTCQKSLVVNPLPECVITGPGSVCTGGSAEFCGPDVAGYTYKWSNGATTRCITVNVAGTYSLEITDAKGCKSTCNKTLTIIDNPSCLITGPNSICEGGSAQFCGPDGAGLAYKWSNGATTKCITVAAAGTYTLEVTDQNGCKSTCQKSLVVVPPTPQQAEFCQGKSVEICGPEGEDNVYIWSTGATTRCITVTVAGTYTVTVSNGVNCVAKVVWTVTANPSPTCAITGELEICEGASTELCGPDVAGLSYKWSTGATTRCITVSLAGIYTLEITDAKGCQSRCEVTVVTKPCGTNCPRTVGFWGQQCAQKSGGSTKFTKDQVTQIAACIDANSTAFSWGDDFGGFCANINPPRPMDCKKQAHRQFAALLANYCTGTLELIANNGAKISLDLNTPNPCKGSFPDAKNLGELIEDMDALLAQLDAENADAQDHRYCMISDCSDGINNGRGIPIDPACAEEYSTSKSAPGEVSTSGDESNDVSVGALELYRPTPNPFTATTTIAYAVNASAGADVQVGIYDVAGRLVRRLVNTFQTAGRYTAVWDGRSDGGVSVTQGVYFLRAMVAGQSVGQSRVLYVR